MKTTDLSESITTAKLPEGAAAEMLDQVDMRCIQSGRIHTRLHLKYKNKEYHHDVAAEPS